MAQHNVVEVHIAVCASQVFDFKTNYADALHEFLLESVEGIKGIYRVVVLLVGGRVVQHEQRPEAFECRLRGIAAHLLRLVTDDDGGVGGYHVDRTARGELVALGVDDAALLAFASFFHRGGESLGVDHHNAQSGIVGEGIEFVQSRTVVDKPAGFLAVMLHEVIFKHPETLGNALANGDARYHNDELRPTVAFVEFKHRFDVDISLAGAGFHFHIKAHRSEFVGDGECL